MNISIVRGVLLAAVVSLCSTKSIPNYLHICKRNDPELNKCLKETVESLREKMIEGMPELGVPSIEPLLITEPITASGSGLFITTKELKTYGGGNFTIVSMSVDPITNQYKYFLTFPHLGVEGKFDVDGKIIMIPIKGDGSVKFDVYEVESEIDMFAKVENVNGINELRFVDMDVDVNVARGKIKVENIFGGEKLISDVINSVVNMNFQFFLKEYKPLISETLSAFVVKTANNVCEGLPYDELFPEA